MTNYKELLPRISTFIFDVDGVLTDGSVLLCPPDGMYRTMNTRDGYALQLAVKKGFNVAIISGGNSELVRTRLKHLGVSDVFLGCSNKIETYEKYLNDKGVSSDEILYMGDDIPDYNVMKRVGLAACPKDAAIEIKNISAYISFMDGGKGCVRDVIEQTLRSQNKWFDSDAHEW